MHATIGHGLEVSGGEANFRASFPPTPLRNEAAPVSAAIHSQYGLKRGPNWAAIALIIALHALLLGALITFDVIPVKKPRREPLVVELLAIAPAPPPAAPEQELKPVEPAKVPIFAPKPIVQAPAAPPPPVTAADIPPPPPEAVVVAPPSPQPAAAGPVSVSDLAAKMVSARPPRYPVESRRRREQGTVYLLVLLGLDGRVAEISLSRSSGSARLDKAALEAVRKWRWSPTLQGDEPVMVRGIVDIPFVLRDG